MDAADPSGNMSAPPASPRKATLFRQEAPDGLTYRIPALLYLPSESTFLAFAEKRSSFRDEHAESLVMRRGLQDGLSVQWGPQEALETAMLPGHRTMNPCPLLDWKSGKVFLFFICVQTSISEWHQIRTGRNAARLCYVASQDGGRTWSPATDLTEQVIGDDLKNWATFAVGPGHGLQLSSGRLVVPAYAYYIHEPAPAPAAVSGTHPHCFVLYSDDGGQSWSRSQLLMGSKTTECQVAELSHPDSRRALYVNARNQSHERCRVEAVSSDEGSFFGGPLVCQQLCEPPHGCQGSVVSFTPQPDLGQKDEAARLAHLSLASHKTNSSWLMFSHPTHGHKRLDLGIYLNPSPLEEGGWKAPWVLHSGPSGYSDLAVCEGRGSLAFGCLFECGVSCECEEIAFRLFTHGELLKNVREACSCPASPLDAGAGAPST